MQNPKESTASPASTDVLENVQIPLNASLGKTSSHLNRLRESDYGTDENIPPFDTNNKRKPRPLGIHHSGLLGQDYEKAHIIRRVEGARVARGARKIHKLKREVRQAWLLVSNAQQVLEDAERRLQKVQRSTTTEEFKGVERRMVFCGCEFCGCECCDKGPLRHDSESMGLGLDF